MDEAENGKTARRAKLKCKINENDLIYYPVSPKQTRAISKAIPAQHLCLTAPGKMLRT